MSEKDHTCDTERFCYICKRSEKQTGKLIKLPNDIYVCPDCMQKSMDMVNQGYFNNFDFNSFIIITYYFLFISFQLNLHSCYLEYNKNVMEL